MDGANSNRTARSAPLAARFLLAVSLVGVASVGVDAQSLDDTKIPLVVNVQPGVVRDGHVEAQLIAMRTTLVRGRESVVGLRLKMDEHWHTYWKNPGDSGLATTIDWTLPDGVTVSDIDWPAPDYFEVGGLASYAYEGEIVLPVRMMVSDDYAESSVTLKARADWLVCRETCEPGEAALTLTLPVTDTSAGAEVKPDDRWAALFKWSRDRQPLWDDAATNTAVQWRDGMYRIVVAGEGIPSISESRDVQARFFPDDRMVIDAAASQEVVPSDESGIALTAQPSPLREGPVDQLRGVVTYKHGDVFRAFRIDEPVRSVADGQR